MQYLGGKLSAAQLQVAGWVGSVRRSLQGALELVWGPSDERQEVEEEEDVDDKEEEEGGDGGGRFQRAMSPLRSFARRSRRSLRRFSARSRQSSQKRATETRSPQANSYITNDEDKLIQTLLQSEQDGISEQTSGADSPTPVPDASSEDLDYTDSQREVDLDAVCENSAPLLDNSSQKSKAVLGRRLTRTRPSRSLRLGSAEAAKVQLSVFKDEKDNQSNSEEEPPESKPVYSSTQRVPMFPGLNPKDLLIGIKKKTGGVAAEAEERSAEDREQETESQNNKAPPSPSQASGTPRVAPRLAGAKLVLPPAVIKDGGLLRPTPRKRTTQQNGET